MKPAPFTYHRPRSLDEALSVLAEVGDEGKVLAGGQSLLPMLSMRLASPGHLVDVNAVPGLDTVVADGAVGDGVVRVGALVRHSALERDGGATATQPLLARALRHVAHPTIRNRGTTVGSIAHADPSAEMPAVLLLLGGSVEAASVRGSRTVAAADLFAGPLETTLAPDELLVAATFPATAPRTGTAVCELARRHGDYAVVGVVAAVGLAVDGTVERARAAYVSAGDGDVVDLTAAAAGADPARPGWAHEAGELARSQVGVEPDIHASGDYRSQLVAVLTARALTEAAGDARVTRAQETKARETSEGAA